MADYKIHESKGYFGRLEGVVNSALFGCEIPFLTSKNSGEEYARRCAGYFESLTLENDTFKAVLDAAAEYLTDFLDENGDSFDYEKSSYEKMTAGSIIRLCVPVQLNFEQHDLLSEEDSSIAFALKLRLKELPDEIFEIAMREDTPVYAGEYRGVSPWNDKLLKKKWNYVG